MTAIKRNRTGNTYLGTDRRYKVLREDGTTVYTGIDKIMAEMHCIKHPGWKYEQLKYARAEIRADCTLFVDVPIEIRNWVKAKAYDEQVTMSEIVRRCIQEQMDKERNRFYIPFLPHNRA